MDKYPMRNFLFNIFIFDKPPMCGRTFDWATQDPRRVLRLYRLVGSRVVLI